MIWSKVHRGLFAHKIHASLDPDSNLRSDKTKRVSTDDHQFGGDRKRGWDF